MQCFQISGSEIGRIAEEKASIINQTQEVAFQEYPTFIETAQCTQEIFQNVCIPAEFWSVI